MARPYGSRRRGRVEPAGVGSLQAQFGSLMGHKDATVACVSCWL
jgi:hypothetical protein